MGTVPDCPFNANCFERFMKEADALGIYVVVPGTGTTWGWLPAPGTCKTADECYKAGGVLGWGQEIIQSFNYPNTLAIVIGNEYDMQNPQFMPVLKGYARDLKSYMQMCNTNKDSPTLGRMRNIPLLYASSDDRGDAGVKPKMDYLFCAGNQVSIDIFGLNIERYCNDAGPAIYKEVSDWVAEAKYPGAFLFSEDGCTKKAYPKEPRDWSSVPGFFKNYEAMDGYIAYAYYGNPDFDMFDGPKADAKMFADGSNFFRNVNKSGDDLPERTTFPPVVPTCASTLLGHDLESIDSVKWYDTGPTGWAPSCPKPPDEPVLQI